MILCRNVFHGQGVHIKWELKGLDDMKMFILYKTIFNFINNDLK